MEAKWKCIGTGNAAEVGYVTVSRKRRQSTICLGHDNTSISCLDCGQYCCNGLKHKHDNPRFCLQDHLPGPLYTKCLVTDPKTDSKSAGKHKSIDDEPSADLDGEEEEVVEPRAAPVMEVEKVVDKKKIRVAWYKKALMECLLHWHKSERDRSPIWAVLLEHLIITDNMLAALVKGADSIETSLVTGHN
ncbi:hypothetical protein BDP27DRAFT_1362391 [Rhodocollybia butyracea]|uniref:Uncharacterized protein n=1 Tax=Rhodocollybia butyracea TaxID=206335 RepID=A0A9P5PWU9_9AGAR|nr:hypothetical protein BDP27DRAFT_1362391 [Rhodocollybia butyracea]